jgi:hypothetical protein
MLTESPSRCRCALVLHHLTGTGTGSIRPPSHPHTLPPTAARYNIISPPRACLSRMHGNRARPVPGGRAQQCARPTRHVREPRSSRERAALELLDKCWPFVLTPHPCGRDSTYSIEKDVEVCVFRAKYEERGRKLAAEIKNLERQCAEISNSKDTVDISRDRARRSARLRDRVLLLTWLGGDRLKYKEIRQLKRQASRYMRRLLESEQYQRIKIKELDDHVDKGMAQFDSSYQVLSTNIVEGTQIIKVCNETLATIRGIYLLLARVEPLVAGNRRTGLGHDHLDFYGVEIIEYVKLVRANATDINRRVRAFDSIRRIDVDKLDVNFARIDVNWTSALKEFQQAFNAIASDIGAIQMVLEARQKRLEENGASRRAAERKRFMNLSGI